VPTTANERTSARPASAWRYFASEDGALVVGALGGPAGGLAVFGLEAGEGGAPSIRLLCQAHADAPGACWAPHDPRPMALVAELEGASPEITLDGRRHALAPTRASAAALATWRAGAPFASWERHVADAAEARRVASDPETLGPLLDATGRPPDRLLAALAGYEHGASAACAPSARRTCGADQVRALLEEAIASETWTEPPLATITYPFEADRPGGLYRIDPSLPGLGRTAWLDVDRRPGSQTAELALLGSVGLDEGAELFALEGPLDEVHLPGARSLRFERGAEAVRVRLLGDGWREGCAGAPCPTEGVVTRVDALEALGADAWLLADPEEQGLPRPSAATTTGRVLAVVREAARAAGLDPATFGRATAVARLEEVYAALFDVCGALPYADEPLDAVGERGVCAETELVEVARDALRLSSGAITLAAYRERWGARGRAALAHRVATDEGADEDGEDWGGEDEREPGADAEGEEP
jgi:hypothetical protein